MAETVLIEIEIPKKGFLNIDADIPEKEAVEVTPREQSFIYHDELFHRENPNQHPIEAIEGLEEELNKKASKQSLNSEIERATRAEQELGERIDNIPQSDLSPYAKKSELAEVATSGKYQDLSGKPTIPSQAGDVHALPDTTKYGSSLSLSIDPTTFVVTTQLKDQDGNNLGPEGTIDLPLESVVVGGDYDSQNKKIILTLENGNTIDVPVGDLVAGLQTEITEQNKLSADLVSDTNQTNKFVTAQEKTTWNGKQNALASGTNIKTVNGNSLLGSGDLVISGLPDQTGQSGRYLTTDGTDASWKTINALQNTATGTKSLTIAGTTATSNYGVNIGYNSDLGGVYSVAIGYNSNTGGYATSIGTLSKANYYATSLGYSAKALGDYSISIGRNSQVTVTASHAIQLGYGTNSESMTFCVGFNNTNYKLLDGTTGKIPDGRLPIAASVSSSSKNTEVVGAKLFYDTVGDIEATINSIRGV